MTRLNKVTTWLNLVPGSNQVIRSNQVPKLKQVITRLNKEGGLNHVTGSNQVTDKKKTDDWSNQVVWSNLVSGLPDLIRSPVLIQSRAFIQLFCLIFYVDMINVSSLFPGCWLGPNNTGVYWVQVVVQARYMCHFRVSPANTRYQHTDYLTERTKILPVWSST